MRWMMWMMQKEERIRWLDDSVGRSAEDENGVGGGKCR
jgi:hypothetical protein